MTNNCNETAKNIIAKALATAKFMDPIAPEMRTEWKKEENEIEIDIFQQLDKNVEDHLVWYPDYLSDLKTEIDQAIRNIPADEISIRIESGGLIFYRDAKEPQYKMLSAFLDHCQTELGYQNTQIPFIRAAAAKAITKWLQKINPNVVVEAITNKAEVKKWWGNLLLEIYIRKSV